MSILKKIDNFENFYYPYLEMVKTHLAHNDQNIESLLNLIKIEKNPVEFRNKYNAILQLFYDGLCDNEIEFNNSDKKNLDSLLNLFYQKGADFFNDLFNMKKNIDLKSYSKVYIDNKKTIIKYSTNKKSKLRKFFDPDSFLDIYWKKLKLEAKSEEIKNKYQIISPIVSGGFDPTFAFLNLFENYKLLPIRFSKRNKDKYLKLPKIYSKNEYFERFRDKNVLLIDDQIGTGKTKDNIVLKLNKYNVKNVDLITINKYFKNI